MSKESKLTRADALKFAIKHGRQPVAIITVENHVEINEVQKTSVTGVSELDGVERDIIHYIGSHQTTGEMGTVLVARVTFPRHDIKIIS